MDATKPKQQKGFAVMDPKRVREIASMGGRTAHREGRAHQFTSEEARAAGKKRHEKKRAALAAGVDKVLMPLVRGVLVEKLSQVAAFMRDELHGPTLAGGKLEPVHPNHRADLRYVRETLQMALPVLKNTPLREQVEASINGMTYIIKRTEEAATSGVSGARGETFSPADADGAGAGS